MAFQMFKWVPDGMYDSEYYQCRYYIVNGNPSRVITHSWLDDGGPQDLPDNFRLPWGSYPDLPPKPPK